MAKTYVVSRTWLRDLEKTLISCRDTLTNSSYFMEDMICDLGGFNGNSKVTKKVLRKLDILLTRVEDSLVATDELLFPGDY